MSNYSDSKYEHEPLPKMDVTQLLAAWAARILSCGIVVLLFVWVYSFLGGLGWHGSGKFFNLHPFFMILGVAFFLTNGVLSWRDVGRLLGHNATKIVHVTFNVLGLVCITLGLYVTITAHGKPHIVSLHSWIALASAGLLGLQALGGLTFFTAPIFPLALRVRALKVHAWLGVVSYIFLSFVLLTGLIQYAAFKTGSDPGYLASQANLISNILGLFIFVTALCATWSIVPRRNIEEDIEERDGVRLGSPERMGLTKTSRQPYSNKSIPARNPFVETEVIPPRRSTTLGEREAF